MLVQALAEYADTYLQSQLSDQAFEEKPVQYAVEIDMKGRFLGVRERTTPVRLNKKQVFVAGKMFVPRSPVYRNSKISPLLGCDAISYVLGCDNAWTEAKDREKHVRQHNGFRRLIAKAAEETGEGALQACIAFYAKDETLAEARAAIAKKKPRPGALVSLVVRPGSDVISNPVVRKWWKDKYFVEFADRHKKGGSGFCLISGNFGPIATTHEKIKGASKIGGRAETSLMSFDRPAFCSYGWKKNANSPVGPERALAYVLAMNDLMSLGEHRPGRSKDAPLLRTRTDLAGVGFLFWTRDPEDHEPMSLASNADPEAVARLFASPNTGNVSATEFDDNQFYLLAVSGNGARLVVREWFSDSLRNVLENMRSWFKELQIADVFKGGMTSAPSKIWELLSSASPPKRSGDFDFNDSVHAERVIQLMRRALFGRAVGSSLLASALNRQRVETKKKRLNPVRVGLIRLCVNDLIRNNEKKGESLMTEALDEGQKKPAYICGRMLAVFEELQYAAQGDLNVNIVERYYALASTSPQIAFPKLETLSQAHLKKLKRENRGAAVAIERKLQELHDILAHQGATFPAQLSLENQGRFAIGYHHQKAMAQSRIKEAKERKAAEAAEKESTE